MSQHEQPAEALAPPIAAEDNASETYRTSGERQTTPAAPDASAEQRRRRALLLLLGIVAFLLIIASAPLLLPSLTARLSSSAAAFGTAGSTPTRNTTPGASQSQATQATATPRARATGDAPTSGPTSTGSATAPSATPPGSTATPLPPQITVAPASLTFSLTLLSCLANPPTEMLTIQNSGGGTLTWQASLQNTAYLAINPASGSSGPAQKMVIAVTLVCSVTLHTTDTLFLTSNGGAITIPITINLI